MQGPISINVGRVSVVGAMKVPVEAERVLIKAVRVPIEIGGEHKEAREYTTISRPLQHSHSREKVLLNVLLQAKRVLVDCRGLESALEAVEKFCFCFQKFWNTSKRFGFVSKFLD